MIDYDRNYGEGSNIKLIKGLSEKMISKQILQGRTSHTHEEEGAFPAE